MNRVVTTKTHGVAAKKMTGSSTGGGGGTGGGVNISASMIAILAVLLLVAYIAMGIYQLDAKEKAVILRQCATPCGGF